MGNNYHEYRRRQRSRSSLCGFPIDINVWESDPGDFRSGVTIIIFIIVDDRVRLTISILSFFLMEIAVGPASRPRRPNRKHVTHVITTARTKLKSLARCNACSHHVVLATHATQSSKHAHCE